MTKPKLAQLHIAIRDDDRPKAYRLIASDEALCARADKRGWTALMTAALNGRLQLVDALLPFSDCEATDTINGLTPLLWAVHGGHVECVRNLLPFSGCAFVDPATLTPLMYAAHKGKAACVEALLAASNLFSVDRDGMTASSLARESGHNEVADLIDAYALAQEERASLASLTEGRAASRAKARSL